jgi:hypothetical protein
MELELLPNQFLDLVMKRDPGQCDASCSASLVVLCLALHVVVVVDAAP